jgi:hypothetical protein
MEDEGILDSESESCRGATARTVWSSGDAVPADGSTVTAGVGRGWSRVKTYWRRFTCINVNEIRFPKRKAELNEGLGFRPLRSQIRQTEDC